MLVCETKEHCEIVVPNSLRHIVYNEFHNKMRHLGTNKVSDLARCFYWPRMYRDIELHITKQCQCIKRKKANGVERAPLIPIES